MRKKRHPCNVQVSDAIQPHLTQPETAFKHIDLTDDAMKDILGAYDYERRWWFLSVSLKLLRASSRVCEKPPDVCLFFVVIVCRCLAQTNSMNNE